MFIHSPSGLYLTLNRAYDPYSGRWLSRDPAEEIASGINLYAYVGDSPVNGVDPFGLCDTSNDGTTCPAVPFKVTGIAPGQAPGTTAISQTPRADIQNGGVAIKPANFGVNGLNSGNRSVFLGMTFTVNWSSATPPGIPSGIPTQGPFSPIDVVGPASVRNSVGNAFDVYNYPSLHQAWTSTRTVMVTTHIPANAVGVKCPQ
jgi:RHS repeat-associated protein